MGLDWDDHNISQEIKDRWEAWVKHLDNLDGVSLSWCYLNLHRPKTIELHAFADASKVEYGIIYYLRVNNGNTF